MRLIRALIILLIVVAVIMIAVLAGGSALSLDWNHKHRAETAALPMLDAETHNGLVRIAANGMEFRARVAGLDNTGPGVVLLHGFPETSAMWIPLIELLSDQGFRVVAFDQRGYSPGARPEALDAYSIPQLVDDVFAVAQATGMQQFHLVGHDWGAAVGWAAVMAQARNCCARGRACRFRISRRSATRSRTTPISSSAVDTCSSSARRCCRRRCSRSTT